MGTSICRKCGSKKKKKKGKRKKKIYFLKTLFEEVSSQARSLIFKNKAKGALKEFICNHTR